MNTPLWLTGEGPDSDVALAARCRLARNIQDLAFPWRASDLQRKTAAEAILNAADRAGGLLRDNEKISAQRLSGEDLDRLIEWRYASKAWAEGGSHRWLIVARNGAVSVLVNEEDHLRIQCILPGSCVESCWLKAREVDSALDRHLHLARDERIGYLTPALTNAGSGMRASVLLHLPGLGLSGELEPRLKAAAELGAAVRGLYGEGTSAAGWLFQVSNRRSFGLHPHDIIAEVDSSAAMLIAAEREARGALFGPDSGRAWLEAEVHKTAAELYRRDPGPKELLAGVSILRLGICEGLVEAPLQSAAEWVSLSGLSASLDTASHPAAEQFEASRRAAALRQRLREVVRLAGTFTG